MRAGDGSASVGLQVACRCSPSPSPVVVASNPRRSLMVPPVCDRELAAAAPVDSDDDARARHSSWVDLSG